MINKYIGESIRLETILKDFNGSSLTDENPIVSIENYLGSMVLQGTGTYTELGTYYHSDNIESSWGTGPLKYWWNVAGANGTAQDVRTNEVNILSGTTEPPAYVYKAELESYYTNIEDYIGEHTQDKLTSVYHRINRRLESLNIKTPRSRNADGLHDASLRDWNAWWGIYYIVKDWEGNKTTEADVDPWYFKYWEEGERIYDDIKKRKIVFRDQVSPSEGGISKSFRTAGSSIATMVTNWDNSYGFGFKGSDFERKWTLECIDTGTSGEIDEASLIWSNDGGMSINGTITSSYSWIHLQDEVYIRWDRGTAEGITDLFQVGDKWEFNTQPIRRVTGGINSARSY